MAKIHAATRRRTLTIYIVAGLLACLALVLWSGSSSQAAQHQSLSYDLSQDQSVLTLVATSNSTITAGHWLYAGPLTNDDDCNLANFSKIADSLKGQVAITKSNDDRTGRVEVHIQRSENNKYYCFIAAGHPIARRIDYIPPTITLELENNKLSARDVYQGPRGPGVAINSDSWQAAVFDAARDSDNYQCGANNEELSFGSVSSRLKHVGQVSYGSTSYLAYYVPDAVVPGLQAEFFAGLKEAVYSKEETDLSLIPFVNGGLNHAFSDDIHLCHRVSDLQGNTGYKLMRLDLGGPAIQLQLEGNRLTASSPAVDLDEDSWQYLQLTERRRYVCGLVDRLPEAQKGSVVQDAEDGQWYCFSVLDKQGNSRSRLMEVGALRSSLRTAAGESGASSPSASGDSQTITESAAPNSQQFHLGDLGDDLTALVEDRGPHVEIDDTQAGTSASPQATAGGIPIAAASGNAQAGSTATNAGTIGNSGQAVLGNAEDNPNSEFLRYLLYGLIGLAAAGMLLMFALFGSRDR